MSLLNPILFFAGLGLLAVPVLLHLIRRRRKKKVVFSSLLLVTEAQRVARSRRRITQWPLLLLRLLVFLLLITAFARPYLRNSKGKLTKRPESIVFVVDRSASMLAEGEQGSAWEEALDELRKQARQLNPGSRVAVVETPSATFEPRISWMEPGQLKNWADDTEPLNGKGDLAVAVGRAAGALARADTDQPRVVHVISDFQKTGLGGLESLRLAETLQLRTTQVGDGTAVNHYIEGKSEGTGSQRRGIYRAEGAGAGPLLVAETDARNKFLREDKLEPDSRTGLLSLRYGGSQRGWIQRTIATETKDSFPLDDRFHDSFHVEEEVKVLLVEPRITAPAYDQKTFFCNRALAPVIASREESGFGLTRYHTSVVSPRAAAKALVLAEPTRSILILPALENYPSELPGPLEGWVKKGGSLILFAGEGLESAEFNRAFKSLLPGTVGEERAVEGERTLAGITSANPVWGAFDRESRRRFQRAPLFRKREMEVSPGGKELAAFADGSPFILMAGQGRGKVLLINASADRAWGDWPAVGGLFVPTLHALAGLLLPAPDAQSENQSLQLETGPQLTLRLGAEHVGREVKVAASQHRVDDEGIIDGVPGWEPGFLPVSDLDDRVILQFAVNLPLAESKLEFLPETVFKSQLSRQRQSVDAVSAAARGEVFSREDDQGWWRILLGALLVLLVAEPVIANRI